MVSALRTWSAAMLRLAGWTAIVAVGVLIVVTMVIPRVNGWVPLTILTGSMEPTIKPGDLVFVDPAATTDLKVGQVVSFMPKENDTSLVYSHRLVSITYGPGGISEFTTRGDANPQEDKPLPPEAIRGTLVSNGSVPVVVPKVGGVFLKVSQLKNQVDFQQYAPLIGWALIGGGGLYAGVMALRGLIPTKRRTRRKTSSHRAGTPPVDNTLMETRTDH